MQCPICFDSDPEIIYDCNHKICLTCSTRLIYLINDRKCPLCTKESLNLSYTKPIEEINKKIQEILAYKCTKCNHKFINFFFLKNHYTEKHSKLLCTVCYPSKHTFPFEYILHTKKTILKHKHMEHVYCTFCDKWFYNTDDCKKHCIKMHFQCSLCVRKYFFSYSELLIHYSEFHFVCKENGCKKSEYVFKSFAELTNHYKDYHYKNVKQPYLQEKKECVRFMDPTLKERISLKELELRISKFNLNPKKKIVKIEKKEPLKIILPESDMQEQKLNYIKTLLGKKNEECVDWFIKYYLKKVTSGEFLEGLYSEIKSKEFFKILPSVYKILKDKLLENEFIKFKKKKEFPAFEKNEISKK